ncbi:MAG: HD domain-containing protein [Ilumatobacteraceae bacterium]
MDEANSPARSPRRLAAPRVGLWDPATWLHWLDEAFGESRGRLWHSRAVWHRVAQARRHELRWMHADDLSTLELAALLHDIGRAIDPADGEPHGFVGARYLDEIGLHDVAPLVAHHSGARAEAAHRGMAHLDRWTSNDDLRAILTYVDRTTGPRGEAMTIAERRDELVRRFGGDAPQLQWFDASLDDAMRGAALFRIDAAPALIA